MKKNILIVGCIICCFILVSLSYQPVYADNIPTMKSRAIEKRFFLGILNEPVFLNETYWEINAKAILRIKFRSNWSSNSGWSWYIDEIYCSFQGLHSSIYIPESLEFKFIGIKAYPFICGVLSVINP